MASLAMGFRPRILDLCHWSSSNCACRSIPLRSRLHTRSLHATTFPRAQGPLRPPTPRTPLKPPANAPVAQPQAHGKTVPASAAVPSRLFVVQLVSKGVPTVLYEAPSHFWYMTSCVGAGCFFFTFALVNYTTMLAAPPEGLMWWIPHVYGLVVVSCGGIGALFLLRARGIVAMIRAVPVAAAVAAVAGKEGGMAAARGLRASPATAAAKGQLEATPLMIEITTKSIVPFRVRKPKLYKPDEVILPCPLSGLMTNLASRSAAGDKKKGLSAAERLAEMERKKAAMKYEREHLLTAPFRHFYKGLKACYAGFRKGLSSEGMVKIKTADDSLKLDIIGGWALEHGRAMDRLLKVGE